MPAASFKTVSDDLLHVAADAETYFLDRGYAVEIELRSLGFPFTPVLVAKRGHETVIVEVYETIDRARVERWIRYSRSQAGDTRVCVVVRRTQAVLPEEIAYAHDNRIGLLVHNDVTLMEVRPPSDLAVPVALPELKDLPARIRPLLAGGFRKFDNDWRDGLGDAYNEVEQLAREYLKQGIASTRVTITKTKKGIPKSDVTIDEVDKMTLGQLKDAFKKIKNQNYTDSVVGSTLELINQTRVGLAHRKKSAVVEADLRRQAGGHLYVVISCLEELTK